MVYNVGGIGGVGRGSPIYVPRDSDYIAARDNLLYRMVFEGYVPPAQSRKDVLERELKIRARRMHRNGQIDHMPSDEELSDRTEALIRCIDAGEFKSVCDTMGG